MANNGNVFAFEQYWLVQNRSFGVTIRSIPTTEHPS